MLPSAKQSTASLNCSGFFIYVKISNSSVLYTYCRYICPQITTSKK